MSLRPHFTRLADAVEHARLVGTLSPGSKATLRLAANELREVPTLIEERDRLRGELAALRSCPGVSGWPAPKGDNQ